MALDLGIADHVRFPSFANQSALPAVYRTADLMILSSECEPCAVVVNDASFCGYPVAAGDCAGATTDLIAHANHDFVFPYGDVPALTDQMQKAPSDPNELARRGHARTPFDGCSLGPPERISAEFGKPSTEFSHEPEKRELFLSFGTTLFFQGPHIVLKC